jgi:hypothetical protein
MRWDAKRKMKPACSTRNHCDLKRETGEKNINARVGTLGIIQNHFLQPLSGLRLRFGLSIAEKKRRLCAIMLLRIDTCFLVTTPP